MAKRSSDASVPRSLLAARPRWGGVVLVCGKCLRRHGEGKAFRRTLKATLGQAAKATGARRPRLVKTACLGLCPKRAVAVASAATLARGEVLLLRDEAEIATALPRLLPEQVRTR